MYLKPAGSRNLVGPILGEIGEILGVHQWWTSCKGKSTGKSLVDNFLFTKLFKDRRANHRNKKNNTKKKDYYHEKKPRRFSYLASKQEHGMDATGRQNQGQMDG